MRATRLIDVMEARGVIGSSKDGSGSAYPTVFLGGHIRRCAPTIGRLIDNAYQDDEPYFDDNESKPKRNGARL